MTVRAARVNSSAAAQPRHLLLPENAAGSMAKADLRKADHDLRPAIGRAVRHARGVLSLKEFAALVDRDERQIARWEDGKERPHFDALFAIARLQQPLVVALSELADGVEIVMQLQLRRRT